MMDLVGITSSDVLEYLKCLIKLNKIDEPTLQIGLLLKSLMDEEGKQNTCMLIPTKAELYKTHPYYIKYITEYKGYMYRTSIFQKEHNISSFVAERISAYPLASLHSETLDADLASLPPDQGKTPTEDQRIAIMSIFKEPLSMIIGGAGTGKTTSLRLLCRYIQTHMPEKAESVLFLAPTGKAVQRIRQSIDNLKFCKASRIITIHRFIYVIMKARNHVCGDKCHASPLGCTLSVPNWAYAAFRDRLGRAPLMDDPSSTPPPHLQMIVFDEAFMIDLSTLNMFIHALHSCVDDPNNMPHIVFIGDNAQLLPVGYGQPILDFERSGLVPIHRLQQIHRHAGNATLLNAVNALREGKPFNRMDDTYSIVQITENTLPNVLLEWVDAHPGHQNAIIVPTNELLNKITPILREHLNPVALNPPIMNGMFEYKFRVGDKVMQIANNSVRNVYNGTCGTILQFIEREKESIKANRIVEHVKTYTIRVRFNDMDSDTLYELDQARDELTLAYAFTTHKAQGSEYDHVLIIMNRPIPGFINRNLIYTGASRGKRSVTIALTNMNIRKGWRDLPAERHTNLVSMIDEKVEYSVEEVQHT
jgi:exodeoxyribonuclease V alpha subunit